MVGGELHSAAHRACTPNERDDDSTEIDRLVQHSLIIFLPVLSLRTRAERRKGENRCPWSQSLQPLSLRLAPGRYPVRGHCSSEVPKPARDDQGRVRALRSHHGGESLAVDGVVDARASRRRPDRDVDLQFPESSTRSVTPAPLRLRRSSSTTTKLVVSGDLTIKASTKSVGAPRRASAARRTTRGAASASASRRRPLDRTDFGLGGTAPLPGGGFRLPTKSSSGRSFARRERHRRAARHLRQPPAARTTCPCSRCGGRRSRRRRGGGLRRTGETAVFDADLEGDVHPAVRHLRESDCRSRRCPLVTPENIARSQAFARTESTGLASTRRRRVRDKTVAVAGAAPASSARSGHSRISGEFSVSQARASSVPTSPSAERRTCAPRPAARASSWQNGSGPTWPSCSARRCRCPLLPDHLDRLPPGPSVAAMRAASGRLQGPRTLELCASGVRDRAEGPRPRGPSSNGYQRWIW